MLYSLIIEAFSSELMMVCLAMISLFHLLSTMNAMTEILESKDKGKVNSVDSVNLYLLSGTNILFLASISNGGGGLGKNYSKSLTCI